MNSHVKFLNQLFCQRYFKLINNFHKIIKFTFIFSVIIGGWSSLLLLSNSSYNLEIREVINKMYLNQKNFIFNVKELSLLLVKDANERFSDNKKLNN